MNRRPVPPSVHLTLYRMLMIALIGLIVGTVSAFATIGFVESVLWLNKLLFVTAQSRASLSGWTLALVTIATLTLGGLVIGLILRYGVKSGAALGPPDTIYAVQLREKLPDPRSGFFSTLAAILSLGCGASVGQYSPLVYLGSLVGQLTNRLDLGVRDIRSIAIACGVAAAISTAFNAPIAALIFTHELILRHYSLRIFTAVTVASACGYIVANVVFQHPALFLIEFERVYHASEFLLFALEGLACGILAVIYMKLIKASHQLSNAINLPAPVKPMIAGFLLAIVALQTPEVLGLGQEVLHMASGSGNYTSLELGTLMMNKIFVTVLCIGFGFAGGVIMPSLVIGVLFGALFAVSIPEILLGEYSGLSVYAICGMVAVASPVMGAPLTAVLIIFEITRNYEITIAAMVTVVFANLVAYHWYGRSLFDTQLVERGLDLSQGRDRAYLQHHLVLEYATQHLPCIDSSRKYGDLIKRLKNNSAHTAIVVAADNRYLGLTYLDQLLEAPPETPLAELKFKPALTFDESTSLWTAMGAIRNYIGEAVPVVDSRNGQYLGVVPECEVIGAYLDAIHDLRREEHEA